MAIGSIRRGRPDEALAVADVLLGSRQAAPGIPAGVHSDDEVREWVAEVVLPEREVWVVADGSQMMAVMVLHGTWVDQLYVMPAHQREGHGSALLQLAKDARQELRLWTFVANTRARAFYEKHGFRADEPASSDNEEGAPALLYRWLRPRPNTPGIQARSTEDG